MDLPLERLANVNVTMDNSSISWEIIQLNAKRSHLSLMVPQNDPEKILILNWPDSFMINLNELTEEEMS